MSELNIVSGEPPRKQAKQSESHLWRETVFSNEQVVGLEPYECSAGDGVRDDDDEHGKDQWTALHHQGVNPHNPPNSMPTPPQEDLARPSSMDIDAVGPGGVTALHVAAMHGGVMQSGSNSNHSDEIDGKKRLKKNFVKELLDLGADAGRVTDTTAETPLHLAARFNCCVLCRCVTIV